MSLSFYQNLNSKEAVVMDSFIKSKVKDLCNLLVSKEKDFQDGYIPKPEIPYIVRSFLQFPSQQNIVDDIIPAIEKLETNDQKIPQNCQIEAIEKYMVTLLRQNTYSSYDKDLLLKAFQTLDSTKLGFLDLHTMFYLLKNFGIKFNKQNIKDMEEFCLEYENDLLDPMPFEENQEIPKKHDQYTTRKFFYENYIRKIDQDNRKRFNNLMNEYVLFASNLTNSNKKFN